MVTNISQEVFDHKTAILSIRGREGGVGVSHLDRIELVVVFFILVPIVPMVSVVVEEGGRLVFEIVWIRIVGEDLLHGI